MTNTKHTPGPWHISTLESAPYLIFAKDGYAVADCKVYHGKHAITADMNLIAAAPDLLEILKEIECHVPGFIVIDGYAEDNPQKTRLFAAIAKAEGTDQ